MGTFPVEESWRWTVGTLFPHIQRTNFICMRDKSYTAPHPILPNLKINGWNLREDGTGYEPVRCIKPPAPSAVLGACKMWLPQVVLWKVFLFEKWPTMHTTLQVFCLGLQSVLQQSRVKWRWQRWERRWYKMIGLKVLSGCIFAVYLLYIDFQSRLLELYWKRMKWPF